MTEFLFIFDYVLPKSSEITFEGPFQPEVSPVSVGGLSHISIELKEVERATWTVTRVLTSAATYLFSSSEFIHSNELKVAWNEDGNAASKKWKYKWDKRLNTSVVLLISEQPSPH